MKTTSIIAILCIGGVLFYVTGGGRLLGLGGPRGPLPNTTEPPNATFMGDAQSNPFFDEQF